MTILGIETSCDDTCAAVVSKEKGEIYSLSGVISSQIEIHKQWGGVFPTIAKREHQKKMVVVTEKALKKAFLLKKGEGVFCKESVVIMEREKDLLIDTKEFLSRYKKPNIDAVAVTVGPGLDPCLWVGINFAKVLSCAYNIPIIPVNHIRAHILSFLLCEKDISFPAVALIASGGHTELVLMKSLRDFSLLGKTRDDAAGECFDKTARVLGLPYPGGPAIAAEAAKFSPSNPQFSIKLPRPMMHSGNYDFSFSGLKTAVLYEFRSRKEKIQKDIFYISEMAKEIQEAISDVLVLKLIKAVREEKAKTVILGGGVSANSRLREKTKKKISEELPQVRVVIPSLSLSTDNAEMIATTALEIGENKKHEEITAKPNLKIYDTM